MEQKNKMLVTPVEPDFYRVVRIRAAENGISMAEFSRLALQDYLKKLAKSGVKNERQPA